MGTRLVVRTLSELCVTVGTLIVLLVVYVLYWTGVRANSAMDSEVHRLQERWSAAAGGGQLPGQDPGARTGGNGGTGAAAGTDTPASPSATGQGTGAGKGAGGTGPGAKTAPRKNPPPSGESFAVMYIPRLGRSWAKPVLQGTGTDVLKKGLGHYDGTAGPGQTGNFAVAGHRRTYGDPLKDLPELRSGDPVVVTDGTTWFTYVVDGAPFTTRPDDVGVIDPVPAESGYRGPGRYLTLTTCEPEWGHSHRLIVWAHLDATRPMADGKPKALLS
ncbi:class E sortase [Streptomyces sp. UNOC14_S4]|uniref:class E sortase n=1 Tax=Streptomyces sp. UNOC14_S4 TaxID=2872340 RepID=UPI001E5B7914|nr:class E sortase [Streptomyces sp. UNOC14_S4]MCC3771948.1 class E sortase [Streptomyces sp. UNOC14_S4]